MSAVHQINPQAFEDSFTNFMSGLGVEGRDKTTGMQFSLSVMNAQQLDTAYRGDWLSRKIIDIPAFDMTREWRSWHSEDQDITEIERLETSLNLKYLTSQLLSRARLKGGAIMIMMVENSGDFASPLDVNMVKQGSLKWLRVLDKDEVAYTSMIGDINSPWFGHPEYYTLTTAAGIQYRIHPSRVVRIIGAELPNPVQSAQPWGDSVLQIVQDAVMGAGLVTGSIAQLVSEAKFDIISIPDFTEAMQSQELSNRLLKRFAIANVSKSITNSILLDKEENWQRISVNFNGMSDVLNTFLMIASGAADIPATRLLGQSPVGMNATGESDIRNYYDRIASDRSTKLQPAMNVLDEVLIRSATGSRDPKTYYVWGSLWQMTDEQRADLDFKKAQTFQIDYNSGLFDPEVLRQARLNQLIESGTYVGIEAIVEEEERLATEGVGDPSLIDPTSGLALSADKTVQEQVLNGAQITAVKDIITAVANKEMPVESAKNLIKIGFPSVSDELINSMLNPLNAFEKPAAPAPAVVPPGNVLPFNRPAPTRQLASQIGDASPAPLYIYRELTNVEDIRKWAKAQGFKSVKSDLHVTIMYCKEEVDWMKMGNDWTGNEIERDNLVIPAGGPRVVEALGNEGAIVLHFYGRRLIWRHEDLINRGAKHRYEDYQPHMTITYKGGDVDLSKIEPYTGPLKFGPEVFEKIEETSGSFVPGEEVEL